jgi:hypothetical protein
VRGCGLGGTMNDYGWWVLVLLVIILLLVVLFGTGVLG